MTTPSGTPPPQLDVRGVRISPTVIHRPAATGDTPRAVAGWAVTFGDFRDEHTTLAEAQTTAGHVADSWAAAVAAVAALTGDAGDHDDAAPAQEADDD